MGVRRYLFHEPEARTAVTSCFLDLAIIPYSVPFLLALTTLQLHQAPLECPSMLVDCRNTSEAPRLRKHVCSAQNNFFC